MPFLIQLAWAVFFMAVARIFAPTPDRPKPPEKSTEGDVDAPTIDEGMSVPVFAGSVKLDGQNVSWFGGLGANAITQQGVTTGYKYSLTVQLTFGFGPIDGIKELRFEDEPLKAEDYTITDTTNYFDVAINAPALFGGDDKEGGVSGTMRIYKGTTTQTHDTEMATLVGAILPGYRRVCYAVARNFYWGTSARLKPFALVAQRWPNTLAIPDGKHRIGEDDCNPVAFLYEILTDPIWGAGEPTDRFDLAGWRAAAATVHGEGLGISLRFARSDSVERVIQALIKYLDASIYEDPVTGLYVLKLVRDEVGTVPVFDKTSISRVSVSRISWTELKNTVKVTFTDRARNYETGGVQAQQSAALASLGNIVDLETSDLPGFHTSSAAVFAAGRLLKSLSYPLSKVRIVGNRSLGALRPGMAFVLNWTRPTLSATYRVTKIDLGTLEDPAVTVEAIEDAFSTDSSTFVAPPGSGWEIGGSNALSVTRMLLQEQPYHWTRADTRSLIFGAAAPSVAHTGYRAVVAGVEEATTYTFAAVGELAAGLAQWTGAEVNLTLAISLPDSITTPGASVYDAGGALLQVGAELLAYRTVTRNGDGTVTFGSCARGSLDTTPRAHAAGESVWVLASIASRPALALSADAAVTVGALTSTLTDAQVLGEQSSTSITTASRALRPVAPGAITVAGSLFATAHQVTSTVMPLAVSWATRTRAATQVVLQTAANQGAEASTTYTLRTYDTDTGTLLETQSALTGTSASVDVTPSAGRVTIELVAVRAGLESFQAQRVELLASATDNLLLETGDALLLETGDALLLE